MVRSQIQMIADNMHSFTIIKDGDKIFASKKGYCYDRICRVEIVDNLTSFTIEWDGWKLKISNEEEIFLRNTLRACSVGEFIDYEELGEFFS